MVLPLLGSPILSGAKSSDYEVGVVCSVTATAAVGNFAAVLKKTSSAKICCFLWVTN